MALLGSAVAHADRDIVYAARYYTPPGSHRTSHAHLYRINPNGTGRTQLTFGNGEDNSPEWSPDGRWIAFIRQLASGTSVLCLLRANGGTVRELKRLNFDDYRWSPGSRFLCVGHIDDSKPALSSVSWVNPWTRQVVRKYVGVSDLVWSSDGHYAYLKAASGDAVLDLRTGKRNLVKDALNHPVWLGQNIVGFRVDEKPGTYPLWGTYSLCFLNTAGQKTKQVKLSPLPAASDVLFGGDTEDLLPVPSSHQTLIYKQYTHADKDWIFFGVDTTSGATSYLTEGEFLAWSPDGSRFCTTSSNQTVPYMKRRWAYLETPGEPARWHTEAEYLMVWATPLFVLAAHGGLMRQLTPRLSRVTEADWRRAPKP